MGFPIYRLASVALGEVMKFMDVFQLIDLAQCSKKSACHVRSQEFSQSKLSLDYRTNYVELKNSKIYAWNIKPGREYEDSRKFGTHIVPVHISHKIMETYWSDRKEGLEILVKFLAKLFRMKVDQFFAEGEISMERFNSSMNFVLENQKDIVRFKIGVEGLTEKELIRILKQIKVLGELWISSNLFITEGFQFPSHPEMLRLDHSSWFTLNHLLACTDCIRIALTETTLTNKDLDVFIGKWKSGEYPKLECLDFKGAEFDEKTSIGQLTPPIVDFENQQKELKLIGQYYGASIQNAVNIRKDTDGVRASVRLDLQTRPNQFLFIVWN
ncbi:unnamed protein product [Caenorhabditis nigoni]